jgi:predicted nucleic acid-binding protein
MDNLKQRLTRHSLLGVDTSVFIYQVEAHPRYLSVSQTVLQTIQAGHVEAITSVMTLTELTVHPWRKQQAIIAQEYEALLVHFPHLQVLDVTRDIGRRAAQLRAHYNLRPADALQVATTIQHGGTAFVTNDRQLTRLANLLDIVMINDFVEG